MARRLPLEPDDTRAGRLGAGQVRRARLEGELEEPVAREPTERPDERFGEANDEPRDLARRQELDYGFEDVDREVQHLVEQLTEVELRAYLKESLFMSFNRFENDRMVALVRKAIRTKEE